MNRTKKYCLYRNCDTNSVNNPDLTLFQFPKNEKRAANWCELGSIDPFDTRPRFMCELHFPRIYMCFSARRKMLLNTAVPRAFGTKEEEDEQDREQVQSSLLETEEVSIEEHLDESMMEESDELATEIIYINAQDLENENKSSKITAKRSQPSQSTPSKIMKLENLSSASRSMVVSSSSTKSMGTRNPIGLTPPKGTILRKVKLKKHPNTTKTMVVKMSKPSTIVQNIAVATEVAVSSSPQKMIALSESDVKSKVSPVKATPAVASSSNSAALEERNTQTEEKEEKHVVTNSPQQKDEAIYEFIFKGEEYVQMPKAKYVAERKKLEKQLEESMKTQEQLAKKIKNYRRSLKDLTEFVHNICEENDDDDD